MREELLEGRKPWNYGRKLLNWKPELHPRGRDGRFVNVFKKLLNMSVGDHRDLSDVIKDAPNIQEATAWRTRDGWELRTRATDGTYGTKINLADLKDNDSVFDDVLQMVNGLQGFPESPFCPCGCGNKSPNGGMLPGHRERVRSRLNADSSQGDRQATQALLSMSPEWYDDEPMAPEAPSFKMLGNSSPDKDLDKGLAPHEMDMLKHALWVLYARDSDMTDKDLEWYDYNPDDNDYTAEAFDDKHDKEDVYLEIGRIQGLVDDDIDSWGLAGDAKEQLRHFGVDLDEIPELFDKSVEPGGVDDDIDEHLDALFFNSYRQAIEKYNKLLEGVWAAGRERDTARFNKSQNKKRILKTLDLEEFIYLANMASKTVSGDLEPGPVQKLDELQDKVSSIVGRARRDQQTRSIEVTDTPDPEESDLMKAIAKRESEAIDRERVEEERRSKRIFDILERWAVLDDSDEPNNKERTRSESMNAADPFHEAYADLMRRAGVRDLWRASPEEIEIAESRIRRGHLGPMEGHGPRPYIAEEEIVEDLRRRNAELKKLEEQLDEILGDMQRRDDDSDPDDPDQRRPLPDAEWKERLVRDRQRAQEEKEIAARREQEKAESEEHAQKMQDKWPELWLPAGDSDGSDAPQFPGDDDDVYGEFDDQSMNAGTLEYLFFDPDKDDPAEWLKDKIASSNAENYRALKEAFENLPDLTDYDEVKRLSAMISEISEDWRMREWALETAIKNNPSVREFTDYRAAQNALLANLVIHARSLGFSVILDNVMPFDSGTVARDFREFFGPEYGSVLMSTKLKTLIRGPYSSANITKFLGTVFSEDKIRKALDGGDEKLAELKEAIDKLEPKTLLDQFRASILIRKHADLQTDLHYAKENIDEIVLNEPVGAARKGELAEALTSRAKNVNPFPKNPKCPCGCGSTTSKLGKMLPGHDLRKEQDQSLFKGAYEGEPAALDYVMRTAKGREQFRVYSRIRYAREGGPELRVDGDDKFSEQELEYDPSRIPPGISRDWEHAPLLDPGPGTLEQQIYRLSVRRDRADNITERGLLNAVISRLNGNSDSSYYMRPSKLWAGDLENMAIGHQLEEWLRSKGYDFVPGSIALSDEPIALFIDKGPNGYEFYQDFDMPGPELRHLGSGHFIHGDEFKSIINDIMTNNGEGSFIHRINNVDMDEEIRKVKNWLDGVGEEVSADPDVHYDAYKREYKQKFIENFIAGRLSRSQMNKLLSDNTLNELASVIIPSDSPLFTQFPEDLKKWEDGRSSYRIPNEERLLWVYQWLKDNDLDWMYKDMLDGAHSKPVNATDRDNSLNGDPTAIPAQRLLDLGFDSPALRWLAVNDDKYDYMPAELKRQRGRSPSISPMESFTSTQVLDNIISRDELSIIANPATTMMDLGLWDDLDRFMDPDLKPSIVEALGAAEVENFVPRGDNALPVPRIRTETGAYQAATARINRSNVSASVIRDTDTEVEIQPSAARAGQIARDAETRGAPVPYFMSGTGLQRSSFSIQSILKDDPRSMSSVAPGEGIVGRAKLDDGFELAEEVEERLRELGAVVGPSSLGFETGSPSDEEKLKYLNSGSARRSNLGFQEITDALSLSVWIDMGDGKYVEYFPQVTDSRRAGASHGNSGSGDSVLDRIGSVDRIPEFELSPEVGGELDNEQMGLGFGYVPWGFRGQFLFEGMSGEEIEDFFKKLFPGSTRTNQVARNLIMRGAKSGNSTSLQSGFADGTVEPKFEDVGVVHKLSPFEGDSLEGALSLFNSWGLLSQQERFMLRRETPAARRDRKGLLKPANLDKETGGWIRGGESPAGDYASGIDGYVFTNFGKTGVEYVRPGGIRFVIDPRQMLRDDIIVSPRDYGAQDNRLSLYSEFMLEKDGSFGHSIDPAKLVRMAKTATDAGEAYVLDPSEMTREAEINIPGAVGWRDVKAIVIEDTKLNSIAAELGLRPKRNDEDPVSREDREKFNALMARIREVAPDAEIVWQKQDEHAGMVTANQVRSANQNAGFTSPVEVKPGTVIDKGMMGKETTLTVPELRPFTRTLGIPDDTKLSDLGIKTDHDEFTTGEMNALASIIAKKSSTRIFDNDGNRVLDKVALVPEEMVGKKLGDYDLSDIDLTRFDNPNGTLPIIWRIVPKFPEGTLSKKFRDNWIDMIISEDVMYNEAFDKDSWFWKLTNQERRDLLSSLPFIGPDGIALGSGD